MGCACLSSQLGALCGWTQPLPPLQAWLELTEVIMSAEWIEALADRIAPAVPDFKWGASTDGSKDDAGWSLVTVQVTAEIRAVAVICCLPVQLCSSAAWLAGCARNVQLSPGCLSAVSSGKEHEGRVPAACDVGCIGMLCLLPTCMVI